MPAARRGGSCRIRRSTPLRARTSRSTIDLELQRAASEILRAGIAYSNADRHAIERADPTRPVKKESGAGAVVALDPRTGEVLAMVSYPALRQSALRRRHLATEISGVCQRRSEQTARGPGAARRIPGRFDDQALPGGGRSSGREARRSNKTYTCTGAIQVPFAWDESKGNTHPCWSWRLGGHGALDVLNAIEQSCDVFFYNVGAPRQPIDESKSDFLHYRDKDIAANTLGEKHYFEGLGIQLIKKNLTERFWFGAPTGIDLPTEAPGVVPDAEWRARTYQGTGWSVGDTINVSIGQGFFLTTPLQLALNTAAFANRGKILKPQLVRETFDGRPTASAAPLSRLFNARLASAKSIWMSRARGCAGWSMVHWAPRPAVAGLQTKWPMTNPTDEPQIMIGGKTGTAEIGQADENGLYDRQHAWFTCFAPFDDPEIAVTVIVEDGGEGSAHAVPVADRVLRAYFELTGRRKRGLVMREDADPMQIDLPVLADSAAFPEAPDYGTYVPVAPD